MYTYPVYLHVFLKFPPWKIVLSISDGEILISSCALVIEITACVCVCVCVCVLTQTYGVYINYQSVKQATNFGTYCNEKK